MVDAKEVVMTCWFIFLTIFSFSQSTDTIVDSHYTWTELQHKFTEQYLDSTKSHFTSSEKQSIEQVIGKQLSLVSIAYIGFDNHVHAGQIICNQSVVSDVKQIFSELLKIRFPIYQCKPISEFHFDDKESMAANNTTCFDFRLKTGSRNISRHAYGLAIDINPVENPYKKGNEMLPGNNNESIGTGRIRMTEETGRNVIRIFRKYGWHWGGNWRSLKDYMHFEKS